MLWTKGTILPLPLRFRWNGITVLYFLFCCNAYIYSASTSLVINLVEAKFSFCKKKKSLFSNNNVRNPYVLDAKLYDIGDRPMHSRKTNGVKKRGTSGFLCCCFFGFFLVNVESSCIWAYIIQTFTVINIWVLWILICVILDSGMGYMWPVASIQRFNANLPRPDIKLQHEIL